MRAVITIRPKKKVFHSLSVCLTKIMPTHAMHLSTDYYFGFASDDNYFIVDRWFLVKVCSEHDVLWTDTWYGFVQSTNRKIELWHLMICIHKHVTYYFCVKISVDKLWCVKFLMNCIITIKNGNNGHRGGCLRRHTYRQGFKRIETNMQQIVA